MERFPSDRQDDEATENWSVVPGLTRLEPSDSFKRLNELLFPTLNTNNASLRPAIVLGQYRLIRRLGEGGMGVVFEVQQIDSNQTFALKVLKPELAIDEKAIQRFRKEATLWQKVDHPHVVRFFETFQEGHFRCLISEFIRGTSLGAWLRRHHRLSETLWIELFMQVARGLQAVHDQGMIHRDLKPENISLQSLVEHSGQEMMSGRWSAKIGDFGLARLIDQGPSLEITGTRSLLGTPCYLAPEQFSNNPQLGPASDLYSLGVSMCEAAIGCLPFDHENLWSLADYHRFVPPIDPHQKCSDLNEGIRLILLRLLEKRPEDRYPSVLALLADLERLRDGLPIVDPYRWNPLPTTNRFQHTVEFRWSLKSSAASLWPLVSHTDRVNRAWGLPDPRFAPSDQARPTLRFARTRFCGVSLEWLEYPFFWVQDRRFSVIREFRNGPLRVVLSEVELVPQPSGGTLLTHRFRYSCRHWIGSWLARWQIKVMSQRMLDKIYRRLDAICENAREPTDAWEAFDIPVKLAQGHRQQLARLHEALESQGAPEPVFRCIESWITRAPDDEVSSLRVRRIARQQGLSESELLLACLIACQHGVLRLGWDILCPNCRVANRRECLLAKIRQHDRCEFCQTQIERDFSKRVELVFEVTPAIRAVVNKTWCVGGPYHAPHVASQFLLQPDQTFRVRPSLPAASYRLVCPQLNASRTLVIRADSAVTEYSFVIPKVFDDPQARPIELAASHQHWEFLSQLSVPVLVRIERLGTNADAITAAEANTFAQFREFFPDEVVSPETLLTLENGFLVAIAFDLLRVDDGGASRGYAPQFVSQINQRLLPIIRACGGELIDLAGSKHLVLFRTAEEWHRFQEQLQDSKTIAHFQELGLLWTVRLAEGPIFVNHSMGYPKYLGAVVDSVWGEP